MIKVSQRLHVLFSNYLTSLGNLEGKSVEPAFPKVRDCSPEQAEESAGGQPDGLVQEISCLRAEGRKLKLHTGLW